MVSKGRLCLSMQRRPVLSRMGCTSPHRDSVQQQQPQPQPQEQGHSVQRGTAQYVSKVAVQGCVKGFTCPACPRRSFTSPWSPGSGPTTQGCVSKMPIIRGCSGQRQGLHLTLSRDNMGQVTLASTEARPQHSLAPRSDALAWCLPAD